MTTSDAKTITILLVEDHEVTRAGLRSLLNAHEHLQVTGEAETVADAAVAFCLEGLSPSP